MGVVLVALAHMLEPHFVTCTVWWLWWPVVVVVVVASAGGRGGNGVIGTDKVKQKVGGMGEVGTLQYRDCLATVLRAGLLHRC